MTPPYREQRRNSSISVLQEGARAVVRKRYFRTYTVADERAAYARLAELIQHFPNLRMPVLYPDSTAAEDLVMEYVPGLTLARQLANGDVSSLDRHGEALCQLFVAARQRGYVFDFDPNNMIINGEHIVLVDPVMVTLPMRHASAVIFIHGMAKISLKRILRPRRIAALYQATERVVSRYGALVGADRREILEDLAAYQVRVIDWNLKEPAESRLLSLARHTLLPWGYAAFRRAILWRARRNSNNGAPVG